MFLFSFGFPFTSLFLGTSKKLMMVSFGNQKGVPQKTRVVQVEPHEVFSSNTRNSVKSFEKGSWRRVVVDDLVPVNKKARPRACNPKGGSGGPKGLRGMGGRVQVEGEGGEQGEAVQDVSSHAF